jgi:O-methyltransferase
MVQEQIKQHKEKYGEMQDQVKIVVKDATYKPTGIADSEHYSSYLEGMTMPRYQPWLDTEGEFARVRLHIGEHTMVSDDRLHVIKDFLLQTKEIEGDIWELGCRNCGVLEMLSFYNERPGDKFVVGYDTFEGLQGVTDADIHPEGDLKSDSVYDLREWVGPGVILRKGYLPDTITLPTVLSFVHMDLDIYKPTKESLLKIIPYLSKGAIIVFDDYGYWSTPGIRKAVDEVLDNVVVLPTGQAVYIHRGET